MKHAYLIVICDPKTNAIKEVEIWSSPEWEQSKCLNDWAYVAYSVRDVTYQLARDGLVASISRPTSRYYPLFLRIPDAYRSAKTFRLLVVNDIIGEEDEVYNGSSWVPVKSRETHWPIGCPYEDKFFRPMRTPVTGLNEPEK